MCSFDFSGDVPMQASGERQGFLGHAILNSQFADAAAKSNARIGFQGGVSLCGTLGGSTHHRVTPYGVAHYRTLILLDIYRFCP